ncbi:4'-phosphopantetheinyl transferase [Kitasatospora sp. NPDC058965]|uniref:4'-phosphopantetheinyl transferase family protein n=1 Tax=Kitasatospora sp. NPDC058965 TaxID=3346682 RepID=UPI0036A676E5
MIGSILPGSVAWAESFGDVGSADLHPAEQELAATMVPVRRREFRTGRDCARRALGRLGLPPGPVLAGPRGEPRWPAGVVGSLTHCPGYRAAVVARRSDLPVLGIDAEPHRPLPPGVWSAVSLPQERARHGALRQLHPGIHWDRALFSAKEAVFKAWYPLTGRPLEFEEADVTLSPDGTWRARLRLLADGTPLHGFAGRWLVAEGLLLTATAEAVGRG